MVDLRLALLTSAPWRKSSPTMANLPKWLAWISAVDPDRWGIAVFGFAPLFSNAITTSRFPSWLAIMSGVIPWMVKCDGNKYGKRCCKGTCRCHRFRNKQTFALGMSTQAPSPIKRSAASVAFSLIALCNAVSHSYPKTATRPLS